jgi:hypothetical protein
MLYWFSPGSIIVTMLVLHVSCLLISPSVPVELYCRDHVAGKKSLLADGGDYDSSSLREKEATWTVVTIKFGVEKSMF